MTISKQKVENRFADPFLGSDINLDLSGFPQFREPLGEDNDFLDTAFGATLVSESKDSLKQAVVKMVNENRDREIDASLKRSGLVDEDQPKNFFLSSGEKAVIQRGRDRDWRITIFNGEGQKTIKVPGSLEQVAAQFAALAEYNRERVQIKPLTKTQQLELTRMCQLGRLQDAIENYLFWTIGATDANDPKYIPHMNSVCWFVFENSTPEFTEDARPFVENQIRGREVLSLPLLHHAFEAFKRNLTRLLPLPQASADRAQPTPTPLDFNDLSDSELEDLKNQTLQTRAASFRRR
jgi:hypothetical protein